MQRKDQGNQLLSCQIVKSAHTDLLHTHLQKSCIKNMKSQDIFVT